jgi:hypothetical protein
MSAASDARVLEVQASAAAAAAAAGDGSLLYRPIKLYSIISV